jgi:thioredoxin-like negative regulator of GroEL
MDQGELLARMDGYMRDVRDSTREMRESNREMGEQLVRIDERMAHNERHMNQQSEALAQLIHWVSDLVDESRAQRRALLSILDRFESGGGPSPAGAG